MNDGFRRPIDADERTGVLAPANLARFAARWIRPVDPALAAVVETYWEVSWNLPPGETLEQRILEFPAITLTIELGDVLAPLVATGANPRVWRRVIRGSGTAFGIRLRPAGLRVVSDLDAVSLVGEAIPLRDARAVGLLERIAHADERASAADVVLAEAFAERPPTRDGLLVNRALDTLGAVVRSRTDSLSAELGVSDRAIQRAFRSTLGIGPKRVARRIRLQEVVRLLSLPDSDAAAIAADLGYVDQAHLVNDFRSATGLTPGAYLRQLGG